MSIVSIVSLLALVTALPSYGAASEPFEVVISGSAEDHLPGIEDRLGRIESDLEAARHALRETDSSHAAALVEHDRAMDELAVRASLLEESRAVVRANPDNEAARAAFEEAARAKASAERQVAIARSGAELREELVRRSLDHLDALEKERRHAQRLHSAALAELNEGRAGAHRRFNDDYLFAATRAVTHGAIPDVLVPLGVVISLPLDLALFPFAIIGGYAE